MTIEVNLDGSGDFETIQEGINDANNGDIVLVYPGRYFENINFMGKTISVVSLEWQTGERHYIHETIIDGDQQSCCVRISNGESNETLIQGFTITNGIGYYSSNKRYGGGFYIRESSIIITNCIIENNESENGGGLSIVNSNVVLIGTTIRFNRAFYQGGGISSGNLNTPIQMSSENRCNIYLNFSPWGKDIMNFYGNGVMCNIIADTLTSYEPLGYDVIQHDDYIINFDETYIDFNAAKIERIEADLYISLDGDDNNSGLSPDDPMQSLETALRYIKADSLHRRTVHLAEGTYFPVSNGEMYPVTIRDYVSIVGAGKNQTIIDLEGETGFIINRGNYTGYTIEGLKVLNGGNGSWNKIIDIYHTESHPEPIIFENISLDNCVNSAFTIINIASIIEYINCSFTNIITGNIITAIPVSSNYSRMDLINCQFKESEGDVSTSSQTSDLRVNVIGCEFSNLYYINDTGQPMAPTYISYGSTENVQSYIINSTFTTNNMEGPYIANAPIAVASGSDLTLINSIIWGNDLTHSLILYNAASSEFTAHHNIFENGHSGIYGSAGIMNWDNNTNYNLDPLFFAPEENNYSLSEGSPAIDAGTLDLPEGIELPEFDASGRIRIYGDHIDIGAYEWNPWDSPSSQTELEYIDPDLICYPNPAYPKSMREQELQIWWRNSQQREVTTAEVAIFNFKGQQVEKIDIFPGSGQNSLSTTWDFCNRYGNPVSTGIYFIRLKIDREIITQQKVTVIR
ncbi:MAG: hypothetical protein K9N06_00755 [Candidatus Cloacimonetes bacterium]|nr:hypothetical protein [Candidatus Cloacimonadota bacterium]